MYRLYKKNSGGSIHGYGNDGRPAADRKEEEITT